MNKDLLARAAQLEAEAKAIRRQEKQFWADVEDRRDEVIKHLNLSDISEAKFTLSDDELRTALVCISRLLDMHIDTDYEAQALAEKIESYLDGTT